MLMQEGSLGMGKDILLNQRITLLTDICIRLAIEVKLCNVDTSFIAVI